jgi:hypothetical protein
MSSVKNWTGNGFQCDQGRQDVAIALSVPGVSWNTADNPPVARLFSNNLVVSKATVEADLVEVAFTGYTQQTTTPLRLQDSNGNWMLSELSPLAFTAGAIGTPDVAYGWYLVDASSNKLLVVENFDAPFHFAQTADQLNLDWRFYLVGQNPIIGPGT